MIDQTETAGGNQRVRSVDFLRGFAILDMVVIHFVQWQFATLPDDNPVIMLGYFFGGLAAPLFLTIAGISLVLSLDARERRGETRSQLRTHIIYRGALIVLVGFVLNWLEYSLYGFWSTQILQCIGFSIILAYSIRRCPKWLRLVLVFAVIGLAPLLRSAFGYPVPFSWTYPHQISTFSEFVQGILANGYYPLFPWFAFVLLGTILGDGLVNQSTVNQSTSSASGQNYRTSVRKTIGAFLLLAVFFIVLAIIAYSLNGPVDIFPATTVFVTAMAGCTLLFTLLMFVVIDVHQFSDTLTQPFVLLGSIALTIYIIHHFIGYNLAGVLGLIDANQSGPTVAFILLFVPAMILLGIILKKRNFRYSLEWLLRRV